MARKTKEEIQSTIMEGEVVDVLEKSPAQLQEEAQVQLQARITACNQELANVLARYKCGLDPNFVIRGNGQVLVNIRIIPVE